MNTIIAIFLITNTIWIYFRCQCNLCKTILLTVVMVSLDGSYRFQIWYL